MLALYLFFQYFHDTLLSFYICHTHENIFKLVARKKWLVPEAYNYLEENYKPVLVDIEDLTRVVISYEIYETSLLRVS